MLHKDSIQTLLGKKGLRVTTFRTQVLEVFQDSEHAISQDQIEKALGDHDRITLYRTLKSFQESGIIHQIALANEDAKYALCDHDCSGEEHHHEHIHFKCTECEEVYCKEVPRLPKISIPGFRIDQLEVTASGVCSACK